MSDMRFSFYVCLMVVGWAIVTMAADPLSRIVDVLKDDNSIVYYANCLLDKGPCPSDGRALKRILPEYIYTGCAKCSENQKQMACKVIFTLQQARFSDLWKAFLVKYDSNNSYQTNLRIFEDYCREHAYI